MTEAKGYIECEIPGCISPASEKCEHCNRDICWHHRVESGDDDLCPACAKMKLRG
jgi:hypothetical protein